MSWSSGRQQKNIKKLTAGMVVGCIVGLAVYFFTADPDIRHGYRRLLIHEKTAAASTPYDFHKRLISTVGRTPVECPAQNKETGVVLVIGQSNAANHGERLFKTSHPDRVLNYFDGACYVANSPLLGSSGEAGEFITPLADQLIDAGTYRTVIILSSAIGSTEIARWQQGADLNAMFLGLVEQMKKNYAVTDIVWVQGENDFQLHTAADDYVHSFRSLMASLREAKIDAPVFIAIATKCGFNQNWDSHNPIAMAQRSLVDGKTVVLGADTDALLGADDRLARDGCHFTESGQLKAATAFADSIRQYHRTH